VNHDLTGRLDEAGIPWSNGGEAELKGIAARSGWLGSISSAIDSGTESYLGVSPQPVQR
jgi:hypothetical protein